MSRTYVVGEVGPSFVYGRNRRVNEHTLVRTIDAIADAGADCVKVQLKGHGTGNFYDGDDLLRPPHDPQRAPFKTRGEYVVQREPDGDLLRLIADECESRGLEWTASPWDLRSLGLLMAFNPPWIKVASASITNIDLLKAIRTTGVDVVMSTGMSTRAEIDHAVEVVFRSDVKLTLAVCTATYPAPDSELHLSRIAAMGRRYGLPVGWSSHSPDPYFAAIAVAAGATWIEQHVTTGKLRWGPDHEASLTPQEFADCIASVRRVETAMGSDDIRVLPCEQAARARLRRAG